MKSSLPPRAEPTNDEMSLRDLLRPLSARALPRSALVTSYGNPLSDAQAQAEASRRYNRSYPGRAARGRDQDR